MMRTKMLLLLITMMTLPAVASNRMLTTEFEVNAPIEKVWAAWTTPEGIKTFFAPDCKVDLRVDGAYDIYFSPDAKPGGDRGSEGMRILGLEPMRRFAFTWNAPITIPDIRGQRTMVILEFEKKDDHRTLVRFTHLGWGEGASWDEAYEYFDHAWNEVVLPRFRYAMEVGAVNWEKTPKLPPVAPTLKSNFTAGASNRMLTTEFEVNAPIEKVWDAWTTPEGIKTFYAPDCKVDLRVDGAYEIYVAPEAKPGERGGEGLRILALEPMRRFAFTWGAPPTIPYVRGQRTMVILEFEKKGTGRTLVRFTHLGWGEGASWDEAYDYFDHAWNQVVLPRFRYAMEVGPVNWEETPKLPPIAATLKANFTRP